MTTNIIIKGAREHNLKNINVEIPRNKINVIVGVSGSGKSTLAYDVIYAEGQRQFLDSISTFAARLLNRVQRPNIESIENLSPTISINQKRLKSSPRSTVGTVTEIYTYLRLLFSRFGTKKLDAGNFSFNNPKGACKECKGIGVEYSIDPFSVLDYNKSLSEDASYHNLFKSGSRYYNIIKSSGRIDVNKPIKDYSKEEIEFLLYSPRIVLSEEHEGFVQKFSHRGIIVTLVERAKDLRGQSNYKKKSDGVFWIVKPCKSCNGGRLNKKALESTINNKNIGDFANMQLTTLIKEIKNIKDDNAKPLIDKIVMNLQYLIDVNLGYLTLNRSIDSISGGENQRLKLARELGTDLIEMVYVLDEPTAGLHPKDRENIINILKGLKGDDKNTVIIIEHNNEIIKNADNIIEIGPNAGQYGGQIVATGTLKEVISNKNSLTSKYFNQKNNLGLKKEVRKIKDNLELKELNKNNLKNLDINIPLGIFCCLTGVSGSGKSTLISEAVKKYNDKLIVIDQKPLVGTAKGNSATYIGVFDYIRDLFAKENNVSKSLFSFNGEGACPECNGMGFIKTDMHFMEDVKSICELCLGQKYKANVLKYKYKNKNIAEVLDMTIDEANIFFREISEIKKRLQILIDVGLGYLKLGQTHDTFSGGEAQRLKLATNLHKKGEIYVLDEPTSGLHYADIEKLLILLNKLIEKGNSVIVVEHNLDLIAQSDWIIDLGPEGGDKGGKLIFEGIPENIIKCDNSYTGQYLKRSYF